jgi:hypothetical protein
VRHARGPFTAISGTIEVHFYLVGTFQDDKRSLWMQINAHAHGAIEIEAR